MTGSTKTARQLNRQRETAGNTGKKQPAQKKRKGKKNENEKEKRKRMTGMRREKKAGWKLEEGPVLKTVENARARSSTPFSAAGIKGEKLEIFGEQRTPSRLVEIEYSADVQTRWVMLQLRRL